jgi:hypothetical protein
MALHLDLIKQYALLFGAAYFVAVYPFDVFFVRKISQRTWLQSCLLSFVCHLLSTLTAFYALPVAAYSIFHSDRAWFTAALLGTGTAIGTSLSEYLLLRLILKKPISGRNLTFLYWNKFAIFWLSASFVLMVVSSGRR